MVIDVDVIFVIDAADDEDDDDDDEMTKMMKTFEGGKLFKHRPRGRDLSLEPQSKSVGAHFGHWLTEI